MSGPGARTVDAYKQYGVGDAAVHALRGVSVEFAAGSFTAIMGPSGSGKSTLLHCAAGLDRLTSGRAYVGDLEVSNLSENDAAIMRRNRVGFVFQSFNLLPSMSVHGEHRPSLLHQPDRGRHRLARSRHRHPRAG